MTEGGGTAAAGAAARFRARDAWAEAGLALAFVLTVAGLFTPAITVTSLAVFNREFSILEGIEVVYARGQVLLALFLVVVSAAFPLLKTALAIAIAASRARGPVAARTLALLGFLSRWSMTDVFVLAFIVILLNGDLVTTADLGPGAIFFASGVLLSSAMIYRLKRRLARPMIPSAQSRA